MYAMLNLLATVAQELRDDVKFACDYAHLPNTTYVTFMVAHLLPAMASTVAYFPNARYADADAYNAFNA